MSQPQKPLPSPPLSEGEGSSSDPIDESPIQPVTEVLSNQAQFLSPKTTQQPKPQQPSQQANPTTPLQQALLTGQSVRPKTGLQQPTLSLSARSDDERQTPLPKISSPQTQGSLAQAGQGEASLLSSAKKEQGQGGLEATEALFGPQPQDPTTRYLLLEEALKGMEVREEERQREYKDRQDREKQKYRRLNDAFELARVEANRPPRRALYNIEEDESEDELLVDATRGLVTRQRRKRETKSPSPKQTSPSSTSPSRIIITQDKSPGRERTTRVAPDSQTPQTQPEETSAERTARLERERLAAEQKKLADAEAAAARRRAAEEERKRQEEEARRIAAEAER